jgi:hypothetical protein
MVQVDIPVRIVGVQKNKKKNKVNMRSSGNCIFHSYGEQTRLDRVLGYHFLHIT